MPLYRYSALDKTGKQKNGLIEATSETEVKEKVRRMGLMLTSIETKAKLSRGQNLTGQELVLFTHQLAQLLSASIPLYESLITLEEQYRDAKSHRVLLSLAEKIKSGESLSSAMSAFPGSFSSLYLALVQSGEAVGMLGFVMGRLSLLLSKQERLRKQLLMALVYPALLSFFCLLVILLLLLFVIPSMKSFFEGQTLPLFTQLVINASDFLNNHMFLLFAGFVSIIFAIYYAVKKKRSFFDRLVLKTPYIKTVKVQAALARFTQTMATLLDGGLTLIDALKCSSKVLLSLELEKDIERVEEEIGKGSSLSKTLGNLPWMPPMAVRMIYVGEESGTLPKMMQSLADIYEEEVQKSKDRLLALMQPLILIVMGAVIAFVMASVLVPLTQVNLETF